MFESRITQIMNVITNEQKWIVKRMTTTKFDIPFSYITYGTHVYLYIHNMFMGNRHTSGIFFIQKEQNIWCLSKLIPSFIGLVSAHLTFAIPFHSCHKIHIEMHEYHQYSHGIFYFFSGWITNRARRWACMLNVQYTHMCMSCNFLWRCGCKCVHEFVCYLCILYNIHWRIYVCCCVFNNNNNNILIKSIQD